MNIFSIDAEESMRSAQASAARDGGVGDVVFFGYVAWPAQHRPSNKELLRGGHAATPAGGRMYMRTCRVAGRVGGGCRHRAQLLASPQGCGMFVLQTHPALAGMNPIGFCLMNLSRLCGVKPVPPSSGIGV